MVLLNLPLINPGRIFVSGLACYNKDPKGSDVLRSRIIIASYAGFKAEERFCEAHSLPDPTLGIIDTLDWREVRALLSEISRENLFRGSVPSTTIELENQSTQLVDQHYAAITALASVVLSKEWEPLSVLKSGANWSHEKFAKCFRPQGSAKSGHVGSAENRA